MIDSLLPAAILPGDKVVFLPNAVPYAVGAQFTASPWWCSWRRVKGKRIKVPGVHSVRRTSGHPVTGEPVIHLVGCYGVSSESSEEPGFPASLFRKVAESRGVMPLGDEDVIQVPIEVSARIFHQLESFTLFPQVEAIHRWDDEKQLSSICRRWVNRRHQSKPIRDAVVAVREEILASGAMKLLVPLSTLGWYDLDAVCKRLEITPEIWLQGVLYNLAHRCQQMRAGHERCLRNAHRKNG